MELDDFTILMKALSDPNRVRALMSLKNGELCVCQIVGLLKLAPSTVSKHMSVLKNAKLVKSRKDGRWIHYRLNDGITGAVLDFTQLIIKRLSNSKIIKEDKYKLKSIRKCDLEKLCNTIMKRGKC